MLEFIGDKGINIDSKYYNVALVHQAKLDKVVDEYSLTHSMYLQDSDQSIQAVFEIDVPEFVKYPIIGVTVKEGVGVATFSYKQGGKRKVRVWLGFVNYQHNGQMINASNVERMLPQLNMHVYIYDINPQHKKTNVGLEIYDEQGNVLFDSDFNPMKIGIKGKVNDGNHVLFCQTFCLWHWVEHANIRWQLALKGEMPVFLDTVWRGQVMGMHEYVEQAHGITPSRFLRLARGYTDHRKPPIVGYVL